MPTTTKLLVVFVDSSPFFGFPSCNLYQSENENVDGLVPMVVVPELVEVCSVLVVEKIEVKRFLFSSKKSHNDMTGRAVRS